MKRLVVCTCLAGALVAFSASGAFGFLANFDYSGHVKGEPGESVGFFIKKTAGSRKRVAGFTVAQIPYHCSDAADGATAGWKFRPSMQVSARRTFGESGEWKGEPLDPVGRVSGKLKPGGIATGEFKLRGELAGPGTHCSTGVLDWRATRQPPPD